MSPDDIIAANLWPWPDPLLKRDQAGNILFVNAAFLQLYGGRVEDWTGRALTGWPAPNTQGAQRFETRAGQTPNESTYDWVEMIMADGNSMAIARNVTALVAQPTPPADTAPIIEPPAPTAPIAPPEFTPPPPPNAVPAAPEPQPVFSAPAPEPEPEKPLEDTLDNSADDYAYESTSQSADTDAKTEAQPEAIVEASEAPLTERREDVRREEDRRMIARRALPIEDSASLLGSNWRDDVIAKALGENAPKKPEPARQATPTEETSNEPRKSGDGLHILLAEDNAINALLTRTLLEAEGATVETVEDGALAVTAVQNNAYDMIFMDMRMPNMDGLESTRKIRGLGFKMPIVALTANAFDDDRNSCFDSGMNDFMTKPVSAEELVEMVETWTQEKDNKKLAS